MGMRRRSDTPGQLLIDWSAQTKIHRPTLSVAPSHPEVQPLIQHLKWDFRETFPDPLPEAIDAGVLDESDLDEDNLRSLHENYAHECLAALKSLDAVLDARRRGIDPATGKPPRTQATRERLRRYFSEEPARLERTFDVLMETYTNAFGEEAADAFGKALRARHAGIDVVSNTGSIPQSTTPVTPAPEKDSGHDTDAVQNSTPAAVIGRPTRRYIARLPVPRPLAEAVKAGRFGFNDENKPIRPGPDEVRAITENHAEKLVELINAMRHSAPPGQQAFAGDYEAAITAYAEDFGPDAARQLEAYVHRQAAVGNERGGTRAR